MMPSQSDRDARIRDRAYQIWLGDGRRHGQDEAHWHQAEREIKAEDATIQAHTAAAAHAEPAPVAGEKPKPSSRLRRANSKA